MQFVRRLLLPGALMSLAAPGVARAGNGIHPRTPVLWEPPPACMTVVDRSESAALELVYTIPYEDTELTADEVEDSRRHQFVALCRGTSRQEPLPVWLSEADVAAAAAKDLVDPADLGPEDVFDTSVGWAGCAFRITRDDQRRPITFAEAMKPVVWDTSEVPVGPYVVFGYTWEPAFNVWWLRHGVVKVVDDLDPAASPPALAIDNGEEIVFDGQEIPVRGCVSAMDGATLTGYYSLTDDITLDWKPYVSDVPVEGDSFELPLLPPPETVGTSIAIKVEVVDPMDRRFTAHMDFLATVLPGMGNTSGDCEESSFIADPACNTTGGDDASSGAPVITGGPATTGGGGEASSGGPATDGTGPGVDPGPGPGGCAGCAMDRSGGALWLLCLALWPRRRRRVEGPRGSTLPARVREF
jgi:hypothetical protein